VNRIAVIVLIVHAAIGAGIVAAVWRHHTAREAEVARLRDLAEQERQQTISMERSLARDEALRAGLRVHDPFVVELLVRERLGWTRPGDVALPPRPPTTASVESTRAPSPTAVDKGAPRP
jgi:hypothetical protein